MSGKQVDLKAIDRDTWLTGGGAALVFLSLFMTWYTASVGGISAGGSGWDDGGLLIFVLALVSAAGVALVVLDVLGHKIEQLPVPLGKALAGLGVAALAIVILKFIFTPDGHGVVDIGFGFGLFLALIGAAAFAFGGYQKMKAS